MSAILYMHYVEDCERKQYDPLSYNSWMAVYYLPNFH